MSRTPFYSFIWEGGRFNYLQKQRSRISSLTWKDYRRRRSTFWMRSSCYSQGPGGRRLDASVFAAPPGPAGLAPVLPGRKPSVPGDVDGEDERENHCHCGARLLIPGGHASGNMEDITYRALRVLREADLVAAEDTRHSRKLLAHFGIDRPVISYYREQERTKSQNYWRF